MTDNSKITGFDTLSTLRFEGFTERNMSELEQILHNLDKSDSVQNIKDFYINLYNHIHSSGEHNIDLSEHNSTFLGKLYEVYRRYGNTGSMSDMLHRIEKNITIATNKDIAAGFNDTKAVTAGQFKTVFNKHVDNATAHRRIYDALVPDATFTGTPTVAITGNNTNISLGNARDFWCTSYGTLVLKYRDPKRPRDIGNPDITGIGGIITVETTYDILTIQGNINITLSMTNRSEDAHKLFLQINDDIQEIPRYTTLAKDTLVMCYNGNNLCIGTTKEMTNIVLPDILNVSGVNISPLAHRFVYYPQSATADEMRFLLN